MKKYAASALLFQIFISLSAGADPKDSCLLNLEKVDRSETYLSIVHASARPDVLRLQEHLDANILGQPELTRAALIALITSEHLLIEGSHGTAKTRLINVLAKAVSAESKRIQFTPDLTPSEITGSTIFNEETKQHDFFEGPIFSNIVMADEINRAPERTQSALFEALGEGQVTIRGKTRKLDDVFLVLATQNPKKQLGTYLLPEAQLDRFMFQVRGEYVNKELEKKILQLRLTEPQEEIPFKPLDLDAVREARREVKTVKIPDEIIDYITTIIDITRNSILYPELRGKIESPVSPRGTLSIAHGARAVAWLRGESTVTKEDVNEILADALRHRILLTEDAKADGYSAETAIEDIKKIANRR